MLWSSILSTYHQSCGTCIPVMRPFTFLPSSTTTTFHPHPAHSLPTLKVLLLHSHTDRLVLHHTVSVPPTHTHTHTHTHVSVSCTSFHLLPTTFQPWATLCLNSTNGVMPNLCFTSDSSCSFSCNVLRNSEISSSSCVGG